jgi:hypothetical protein
MRFFKCSVINDTAIKKFPNLDVLTSLSLSDCEKIPQDIFGMVVLPSLGVAAYSHLVLSQD